MFSIFKREKIFPVPSIVAENFGFPPAFPGPEDKDLKAAMDRLDLRKPNFREVLNAAFAYLSKHPDVEKRLSPEYQERFRSLKKAMPSFDEADAALSRGELGNAAESYQRGLMQYPYLSYARLNLGFLYRQNSKLDLSARTYEEGLRHAPNNPLLWSNLGRSRAALGNKDGAIQAYYRAVELSGGNEPFCMMELERLGGIIRMYRDPETKTDPVWIKREDYRELLKKQIADSTDEKMFCGLFLLLLNENHEDLVAPLWTEHHQRFFPTEDAYSEVAYLIAGIARRMSKDDDEARRLWRKGLEKHTESAALHSHMARVTNGVECIQHLEKAFERGDRRADSAAIYFQEYRLQHGEDAAMRRLEELFEIYREFGFIHALALQKFKFNSDEHIEFLLSLVDKLPEKAREHEMGAIAGNLGARGRTKEAILITERLIRGGTRDVITYWNWALAKRDLGQGQDAVAKFEELARAEWLTPKDKAFVDYHLEWLRRTTPPEEPQTK